MAYMRGPGPLKFEHEKIKLDIAIVENDDVSKNAIAEGQYVIWKDNLCIATSDIQIGTVLSDSNLALKTNGVGDALFELQTDLQDESLYGIQKFDAVPAKSTKYLASTSNAYTLLFVYLSGKSYLGAYFVFTRAKTGTNVAVLKPLSDSSSTDASYIEVTVDGPRIKMVNSTSYNISIALLTLGTTTKSKYVLED